MSGVHPCVHPCMHLSGVISQQYLDGFSSNLAWYSDGVLWGTDAHETDFGSVPKYGNYGHCLSHFEIFLS